MDESHLHADVYKDPRTHALHLVDITIGGPIHLDSLLPGPLRIFCIWEIWFRKPESSDVNCWSSEALTSSYSEVVSPVDFFYVCWPFAASIILMILDFWIIQLYVVIQIGDAVGVGWYLVGSVSDDFLDFFV